MKAMRLGRILAAFWLTASPAFGDELLGIWLRDDGSMRVKFDACGDVLCGTILWLKPGIETKAKVGQRLFSDLRPVSSNSWTGTVTRPANGSAYSAKLFIEEGTLTTSACTIGGVICKSFNWKRAPSSSNGRAAPPNSIALQRSARPTSAAD
jgi:uncharacterized protein (DUF2147 family)